MAREADGDPPRPAHDGLMVCELVNPEVAEMETPPVYRRRFGCQQRAIALRRHRRADRRRGWLSTLVCGMAVRAADYVS